MSEDIRVGDRFLIEVEVKRIYGGGDDRRCHCLPKGAPASEDNDIALSVLRNAKRLPRPLRVGDKVLQRPGTKSGVVEWMDDIYALVRWPACGLLVVPLDTLTLADEGAS